MSEDKWVTRRREETAELSARLFYALDLMLKRSHETGKKDFVWISHSAILSVLFAQLEKRPRYAF